MSTMFKRSGNIIKTIDSAVRKISQPQTSRSVHQAAMHIPAEINLLPTCRPTPIPALNCRKATMHDKDKIVEFLCYMFINREPLMKVLNATIADAKPFVDYHVKVRWHITYDICFGGCPQYSTTNRRSLL